MTVTFTATDNVGNTNTVSYVFYEDNSNPSITDPMSDYAESGDTSDVYGIIGSDLFYFSDTISSGAIVTLPSRKD